MSFPMKDFSLKDFTGYNTADDCPIPDGLSASDVSKNIREALKKMGCQGRVDILVYGDTDKILVDGLVPQGIDQLNKVPEGDKHRRRKGLADGLLFWILANKHRLSNLMLIIGDISDNSGILYFLHQLAFGRHNFLIAQDSNCRRLPIHHDLRLEWRWPDLGRGSDPVYIEQVPDFNGSWVEHVGNDTDPDNLEDDNDTDLEDDNDIDLEDDNDTDLEEDRDDPKRIKYTDSDDLP